VLEFVAEEGRIYIPYWMFRNLCLQEGQRVTVKSGNLPKGDFVKFQPQSPEFIDIHNPKVGFFFLSLSTFTTLK
jgi:ubiquitin fusion degradation protein 1